MSVDFVPGNPEHIVVGKTEKPAKRHRPQPPKPVTEATIKFSMENRMDELKPRVAEYAILEALMKVLEEREG
jgi:hypothetical protein